MHLAGDQVDQVLRCVLAADNEDLGVRCAPLQHAGRPRRVQ